MLEDLSRKKAGEQDSTQKDVIKQALKQTYGSKELENHKN